MRLIKYINLKAYFIIVFLLSAFIFSQCTQVKSYEQLVQKEMNSGERNDTLFLGVYFGMTSEDFYKHCWDLNKKGILKDGFGNVTAAYELSQLKDPAYLEFYPTFKDDKINSMPASVRYKNWSPWNSELTAEMLLEDTKLMLAEWYDVSFYPIVPKSIFGKAYVAVAGNMRIVIQYSIENKIDIIYNDLRIGDERPLQLKLD